MTETLDAVTLRQRSVQFTNAWFDANGQNLHPSDAVDAVQRGWTVDTVHEVTRLARFALAEPTPLGSLCRDVVINRDLLLGAASTRLLAAAVAAVDAGVRPDRALRWMSVVAAVQDPKEFDELPVRPYGGSTLGQGWSNDLLRAWDDAAGPLAPIAYAAGLTPAEAIASGVRGDLTEDALLTLVSLRGWRLP